MIVIDRHYLLHRAMHDPEGSSILALRINNSANRTTLNVKLGHQQLPCISGGYSLAGLWDSIVFRSLRPDLEIGWAETLISATLSLPAVMIAMNGTP
jgi:hypothetical protein